MKLKNVFYSLVFICIGFAACAAPMTDYQGDVIDQVLDEMTFQKAYVIDYSVPKVIVVSTDIVSAVETTSTGPASPFDTIINYNTYRVPVYYRFTVSELNVLANDRPAFSATNDKNVTQVRLPLIRYL